MQYSRLGEDILVVAACKTRGVNVLASRDRQRPNFRTNLAAKVLVASACEIVRHGEVR